MFEGGYSERCREKELALIGSLNVPVSLLLLLPGAQLQGTWGVQRIAPNPQNFTKKVK